MSGKAMFAIVTSRNPTNVPSATTASTFHLRSTSGGLGQLDGERDDLTRPARLRDPVDEVVLLLLRDVEAGDVLRGFRGPAGLLDETHLPSYSCSMQRTVRRITC